ncbi:MAG: [protein-PII] uridylyltransferase [Rhodospirillaceae bacterium]|jgi:[protein-PII] uridylyltransferase|nr:[protein-PII] uridylyltransferase [Rhodospirillaceae bacterium]MBT4590314.1 [protein-PII] uridylyltransferase [Rhodospirillaceae bacterium]MBT7268928.1 [protein-PII] uridylyltransferase [Rhodospirillaceae bacterium]
MTQIKQQRKIIDRLAVVEQLDAVLGEKAYESMKRQDLVAVLKEALQNGKAEVQKRFEKDGKGSDVVHGNSFLIDQLVRIIYDLATTRAYPAGNRTTSEQLSIVAVGGYGRGELAPFSDVDLMFVIPYKETPYSEQIIEFMLYMLWDMGLKVGHSTRSVDDAIRLSKQDLTIRTAILDARWLWGDQALFGELTKRYQDDVVAGSGPNFVEAKLQERDDRHERMGDTRYVVEPNVKEGKGGLRDLQTLYWLARYLYGVEEVEELVPLKVFTKQDVSRYRKACDFLWTVRCHIHYLTNRAEERVSFDVQKAVGEKMEYNDRPGSSGVERFMKHYFLMAKDVGDLTRVLCAVLEDQQKKRTFFRLPGLRRRAKMDGFVDDHGRIMVEGKRGFRDDPIKMIRVFYEAQKHDLDIHPEALRRISRNLKLIDKDIRDDPDANRMFIEILTSKKDPEIALRRMNEADVLGKFIPDFGRVVAQMQYDMYHTYTVDEHTIRAIGILSRVEDGSYADDMPNASQAVAEVQSRRALYVAVLLHDIAKGRGGDHSELGAELAKEICPRFGLSAEETETVSWLVLNHLMMSDIAFKRDIDDPKTIKDFVASVKSVERLRLLAVLTVVDIRAVGPKTWNAWKSGLLRGLYQRALETMSGDMVADNRGARIEYAKGDLRDALTSWDDAEKEEFISTGYPAYWLAYGTDVHQRHAEIVRAAKANDESLHIDIRIDDEFEYTELTVYTPDHPGIFSQIAGAVALSGATIMDAKIVTMSDGMVMDSFSILDINNQAYNQPRQLDRLRTRIDETLAGKLYLDQELAKAAKSGLMKKEELFNVAPRILVDNNASSTDTVIEVNGRDRVGFLYDVTTALNALGLKITSAHITTYGAHVVDAFYVKDIFGLKIKGDSKLDHIRRELLKVVEPDEEKEIEAAE